MYSIYRSLYPVGVEYQLISALSTSAKGMDICKWIALSMVICIGVDSATEPDWSCDFEVDSCGIIEEEWTLTRNEASGEGRLQPETSVFANVSDIAIFSIPFDFTSSEGNLSFEYFLVGSIDNTLTVTVCQGDIVPTFTLFGGNNRNSALVPYSCANKANVQIRFIATRGKDHFAIRVMNIQIFQMPIAATTPPPQTLPTLTSRHTDSTESLSTNTAEASLAPNQTDVFTTSFKIDESTTESTTNVAVRDKSSTPSPVRQDMPWLIPVVASVVVLLLITIAALVVLYCHRQSKQPRKQGSTDRRSTNEPNRDIDHYAGYKGNRRPGSVGNGRANDSTAQSNNDTDIHPEAYESVDDAYDVKSGDRVGNPVYTGINPTSKRDEDVRYPPLIINPIYNGMDIGNPDPASFGDLVDNPLYGGQRDNPQGEGVDVNIGNERVEDGRPQHLAKGSVLYALAAK